MLKKIELSKISPNPDQPRKLFEAGDLNDLANSIKNNGLMQPITVRPVGEGRYELVAGERRWRAHCLLAERGQLEGGAILAHVRQMDDTQRDIEAIIENLARADITPLEQARAFQRMLDTDMSVEELSKKLGLNQPWRITEKTRLLNLAPEFLKMYERGHLGGEAAFEISRLTSHRDQTRIIQMISRGQLTGYKAIKAAVSAVLDNLTQADIFGASAAPRASEAEVATVERMEARIERVGEMISAGWKDGACEIAARVSPDRAGLIADRIAAMQKALRVMEQQLREVNARSQIVFGV